MINFLIGVIIGGTFGFIICAILAANKMTEYETEIIRYYKENRIKE